tara:strand:+ start:137 stop:934 length:798 start_codon:yes stop_codon:yes gene_type:complete
LFFIKKKQNKSTRAKYKYLNKKIIVFGGGSGYGFEIAKYIFINGGDVILISKNKKKLLKAKNKILLNKNYNNNIYIYNFDLNLKKKYNSFFKILKKKFNHIDIIFQCSAIPEKKNFFPILTSEDKYLDNMINLNFLSNIFLIRNFISFFKSKKKTRFIFFTSKAAWSNKLGFGLYNLTKSCLNSFIYSLSEEIKYFKKNCNLEVICFEPGEAKTEMNKESNIDADIILNAIKFLLNSKRNLNGLFVNRELLSLTYLNSKKINIDD